MKTITITCPVCNHCKKLITIGERGVIVHGDINMVNVTCPKGDQGGIVGSNFPRSISEKPLEEQVRRMPFHLACLTTVIDAAFEEDWTEQGNVAELLSRP